MPRRAALPTPTIERRAIRLEGASPQRVVAVADTHSAPDVRALAAIEALAPALILHAGDVGDLEVLDRLSSIAPVVAVRGNIDGRRAELPDVVVLDLAREAAPALRVLLLHIAVAGPRLRAEVHRLAARERPDLVVCGHSHVPFLGRDRGVAVFNPGSIGPRRFALPIAFGVLSLGADALEAHHVDAETGAPWRPSTAAR